MRTDNIKNTRRKQCFLNPKGDLLLKEDVSRKNVPGMAQDV